jgi:hypothetical protein
MYLGWIVGNVKEPGQEPTLPVGKASEQLKQELPSGVKNLPAAQTQESVDIAPSASVVRSPGHNEHAVWPTPDWYLPAGQALQSAHP